jgi:hypothetical protein
MQSGSRDPIGRRRLHAFQPRYRFPPRADKSNDTKEKEDHGLQFIRIVHKLFLKNLMTAG